MSAFIAPLATAIPYGSVHGVVNGILIVNILFIGKSIVFVRHQTVFDNVMACEIIYLYQTALLSFNLVPAGRIELSQSR